MKQKLLNLTRLRSLMLLTCVMLGASAWGDPTVLFHETFGNNTGSARNWSDSYSVKSGVESVYSEITSYSITNAKQGKNTTGSTLSGLNQSTSGTDAVLIVGPLNVADYSSLNVTYQWKAASTKGSYTTSLYYATSSDGTYTEVTGTGAGATSFVERSYSLPKEAQVSTLYLKIVWNTSNTQAIIDEVELTGITSLVESDLSLINAPITLNFDLYDNNSAQTISYTTSSTGDVTVSGGEGFVTISVNQNDKTITVTPTNVTSGEQIITVHQTADDTYFYGSVTFGVVVTNSNAPGTRNNPYTVAQAIANTPSSGNSDEVYIRGVVSSFYNNGESIMSDGTSYRYYISDNGGTTTQLLVYKGKKSSTENFSSANDLLIGDEVVIYGKLTMYNNAPEVASGNYIISRATKADPELAFATTTFSANIGEDFTPPTLTNPHNLTVTYSSSDEDLALVDENTGEVVIGDEAGEVTITASFAGNETYRIGSASYTITIVDPNAPDGSFQRPYTVADLLAGRVESNQYVKGFIVGCYNNGSRDKFTNEGKYAANLALADNPKEDNETNTAAVQLANGSEIRAAFNTVDKPYNIGVAQVVVKGSVESYLSAKGIKSPTEMTKIAEYVTVTSAGYATYYTDCALDFTGTGITASTATCDDGRKLVFAPHDVVPANTGVLLHKDGGGSVAVPVAETADPITDNCFVGTLTDITTLATADGNYKNYILNNKDGNVGFYWANGQKVGAHRAYAHVLTPNSGSTQSFISINPGEESGIENVSNSAAEDNVYDLQGRRVAQPQKGLYIVNGKKVIIK